ncbi:MAG: tetratricopeptide repeat protein [Planctomycetales bacterium]|nr:tetratricopeptide repeat protein [Planctomycetales bacterium]
MIRTVMALAVVVFTGPGCETAFGKYLAGRARDLGDCFRLQAGVAYGLGGGVQAAGLAHVGLGVGFFDRRYGGGWMYGEGYAFGADTDPERAPEAKEGEFYLLVAHLSFRRGWGIGHAVEDLHGPHLCWVLVPAALTWERGREGDEWIWTDSSDEVLQRERRWARVHAFDMEASAYAGVVGLRAGFSPGEFLDFLLGWFGLDIAGDDGDRRAMGSEESWRIRRRRDREKLVDDWITLLESAPSRSAKDLVELGILYRKRERMGRALECFEAARRLDPANVEALLHIAGIYRGSRGEEEKAIPYLEEALRSLPEGDDRGPGMRAVLEDLRKCAAGR